MAQNKIEFKNLSKNNFTFTETSKINNNYINETSVLSSNISFIRGIQKDYGSVNYPASALFYYKGRLISTSTGSATALYELLRGYLYRDDLNPSVSSLTSIIQSKTSTSALTGFRMILFNKSVVADMISPNSFRMSIVPYKTKTTNPTAIFLSNSAITDNVTTGSYTNIIGDQSLTGSLMTGVSGSVLSGFTIRMKVKLRPNGPPIQTLFHRRVADWALSSLDWTVGSTTNAIANDITFYKYGSLNPLSASTNVSSINFGTFEIISQLLDPTYKHTFTADINISNSGGGQIFYSTSSNFDSPTSWLSICASSTAGIVKTTSNITCNPSLLRIYVNDSITSTYFQQIAGEGATINTNIVVYNEPTNFQKTNNLPITIPISMTLQL